MRDPFRWSISLGKWGATTVRVHVFFVVFAVATMYLCWPASAARAAGDLQGLSAVAVAAMAVLFLSVLLHEWSHWWVARRYGLQPDTLVLGPLGGLSQWRSTGAARGELVSLLAGPMANLLVCLVCAGLLSLLAPPIAWSRLFNPLRPDWTWGAQSLAEQGLKLTLWINWLLFLFNWLPAYPFDGGRILRSAISWLRPQWSEKRLTEVVFWTAIGLSAALLATALFGWKHDADALFPSSFALLLLAVVLLVSARRDMERAGGTEPVEVYDTELEDPWPVAAGDLADAQEPSIAESWPASPSGESEPTPGAIRPEEIEAEEERQVDEILTRLHEHGMASLTAEQRQLLERVSARYRHRLGRHT